MSLSWLPDDLGPPAYLDALRCRAAFYIDPETGFIVVTEDGHRERGWCCGSGCRHCPWEGEALLDPAAGS